MLKEIKARNIRLPDEGQKVIYDNDDVPVASADFYYNPKIVVFVDGSPHYLDYVQAGDEIKRKKLLSLGYRVVVIKGKDDDDGMNSLISKIG